MRFGFIGTGRIAEAVVIGLCTSPAPPEEVLLWPRNAAIVEALATRFPAAACDGWANPLRAHFCLDLDRISGEVALEL